jgi:hypothetical protein
MAAEAERLMTRTVYGIKVMPKGDAKDNRGKPVLMLVFSVVTEQSQHDFYLCDVSDNYQDIAKQIHDRINEAGRQGRKAQTGLIVVEGGSDGLRSDRPQQGRKFSGKGSESPEGPRPA